MADRKLVAAVSMLSLSLGVTTAAQAMPDNKGAAVAGPTAPNGKACAFEKQRSKTSTPIENAPVTTTDSSQIKTESTFMKRTTGSDDKKN